MAEQHQSQQEPSLAKQAAKAATAFAISGVLLVISGLTLTGTMILVTVATPLLLIFSPVLVPAAITVFFIVAGFITSGGLGVAAASVMSWIYQYVTGKHPPGSEKLDHVQMALASKARDMKDRAGAR